MRDRVLVVEDDPATRRAMADLLQSEGFEVATASSGRDALALAGLERCLVLLDLRMPDMDGTEFLRELRSRPDGALVAVVLVSADSSLGDRGRELGVASIRKPVDVDEMLAVVEQHCRRR